MRGARRQIGTAQAHPCVGQGEQGHQAEGHPGVQRQLHAHHRRQQFALGQAQLAQRLGGLVGGYRGAAVVFELSGDAANGITRLLAGRQADHRGHQAEDHPGKRRVRAGHQQPAPHHCTRQHISAGQPDADTLQAKYPQGADTSQGKTAVVEPVRIEQRDQDYRDHVVDHRQGQQEDAHTRGNALAQQRQQANGEGNIGRCGNRPAIQAGALVIEAGVDQRRHHHPATSGRDRQ
ncbi:hypothetical protein SRABI70_01797 [Pseudomonas sp. Bi70]|nr:hypothetical protein SRABI70_01797 [Pseudomonas sp. Bi70]